jgi:hypothetical protein
VQASDVDALLASTSNLLPVSSSQSATGTSANSNSTGDSDNPQTTDPFESAFEILPETAGGQSGSGADWTDEVGQGSTGTTNDSTNEVQGNRPAAVYNSPVSEQVALLLNGALLTEATSDSPNQTDSGVSKKERRRPTFLYIKPIPLPDLIPDITLPM